MKRILTLMLSVSFSISFLFGCTKPSEEDEPETIRDRVVSASHGYRPVDSDGNTGYFAKTGFYKAFHSADWKVQDPFTDATKYYGGTALLSHSYPYKETHRAIARSTVSSQQVFIIHGEDPELKKRVEKQRTYWAESKVQGMPNTLKSKDGLELTYEVFHIKPGALAGDEVLLEVAFKEDGDELLILDAGLSYGRQPSGALLAQPLSHVSLKQMVKKLKLKDLL